MICRQQIQKRFLANSVAVLLEGNGSGDALTGNNKNVITAARKMSDNVIGIVLNKRLSKPAGEQLGLSKVFAINGKADLRLSENACEALKHVDGKIKPDVWMAAHSAFGKNIMPRLSVMLGIPCLSDVIEIESDNQFKRPIYAGNAIASVQCDAPKKAITIRSTAFEPLTSGDKPTESEEIEAADVNSTSQSEYLKLESAEQARPELGSARVVISGGRALKTKEDFDRLIGGLADSIPGAAVGASRAAVDAGLAPNDLQVGQTGKVVAPALYIAVGISGAIQHVAGMKDAKVIVAINKDADCPIFQIADYGLVGDLFKIVPELTDKLRV